MEKCASLCARADAEHMRKLQLLQEKYVALGNMELAIKVKDLMDKRAAEPLNPMYWCVAPGKGFFGGDWVEHHNNRLHRIGPDRMHYDYWGWSSNVRPNFGIDLAMSSGDVLVFEDKNSAWIRFENNRSVIFWGDKITRLNRKEGSVTPEGMLGAMPDVDKLVASHYAMCARVCAPLASKYVQLLQKMQKEMAVKGDIDGAMELGVHIAKLPETNRYFAYTPQLSVEDCFRKTFQGVWREDGSNLSYKFNDRGNLVGYGADGKQELAMTLDGVSPLGNVFRVKSNKYSPVRYIARVGDKMIMFLPENSFWLRISRLVSP